MQSNRDNGNKLLDRLCNRYKISRENIKLINLSWWVRGDNAFACYPGFVKSRCLTHMTILFALSLMSIAIIDMFNIFLGFGLVALMMCVLSICLLHIYHMPRIFAWPEFLKYPNKYLIVMGNVPDRDYNFTLTHEFVHIKNRLTGMDNGNASDYECMRYLEPYTNAEAGVIYKEVFGKIPLWDFRGNGFRADIRSIFKILKNKIRRIQFT